MWGGEKYRLKYEEVEQVIITGNGATNLIKGNVKLVFYNGGKRKFTFSFSADDISKIRAMVKLFNSKGIELIAPPDYTID